MADAVRRALAGGADEKSPDWHNPATGSSGTLAAIGEAEEDGGATCRIFASTVTSIRGVHLYTSRACRSPDGRVTVGPIEAGGTQLAVASI